MNAAPQNALGSNPIVEAGGRTLLMAIVNVTPDSFSDGGRYLDPAAATAAARLLAAEGADILDIGGESTRPGAAPVALEEETARILPVVAAVRAELAIPISIDTMKARVAAKALEAGATIVNDVKGFLGDPDMARVAAEHQAVSVLMHWESHEPDPDADIHAVVRDSLARSVDAALAAGLRQDRLILDPGIGFGKTVEQNLALIAGVGRLKAAFGLPVLIGASRKRMISAILGTRAPDERLPGTLALHAAAVMAGADVIRAHDAAEHADMLRILHALKTAAVA
ncbi:MAG: dihydropteroate synthase [Rubrimonas sp.]